MIKENMEKQLEHCDEAPFYTLGPLTTDIAQVMITSPRLLGGDDWLVRLCNAVLCNAKRTQVYPIKRREDGVITYKMPLTLLI
jgi:phosphomethylpyrimidine synthase